MHCRQCGSARTTTNIGQVGSTGVSISSDMSRCAIPVTIHYCEQCDLLQKQYGDREQAAINHCYQQYAPHHLSDGNEQLVFPEGKEPRPRTYHSLEQCLGVLPASGRLLDVGCGNGAFLKSAAKLLPGWELEGYDISDSHHAAIMNIPGVRAFHVGDVNRLPQRSYDLIVLWHVLEHVCDPLPFLSSMANRLTHSGQILLQIPDTARNPFDLAVIDHCSHYTEGSFNELMKHSGLELRINGDNWIHNCLTRLVKPVFDSRLLQQAENRRAPDGRKIFEWLRQVRQVFSSAILGHDYALFGTGSASLWLSHELERPPVCFVDEDSSRWGKVIDGAPIISPEEVRPDTIMLLPFLPDTGSSIISKLSAGFESIGRCTLVLAPPLGGT